MANKNLTKAKSTKNDEFYTQFHDIEKEVNSYLEYNPDTFRNKVVLLPCDDPEWSNFTRYFILNFETLGLKKLISTCIELNGEPAKKFVMEKCDIGNIQLDNINFVILNGDGDFRSEEITKLRDNADIVITNPPFSLFREFFAWLIEGQKQFLMIGNQNSINCKEVFPYIKANKTWLGVTGFSEDMVFAVPNGFDVKQEYKDKAEKLGYIGDYTRLGNSCWFTNIEHGRRHTPIPLMTMKENLKYSSHKELKGKSEYMHYDDYDAIEVPYNDSIPSDYEGIMGVPITFIDRYCPEQFEIIGIDRYVDNNPNYGKRFTINGKEIYARILIRKRRSNGN